MANTSEIRNGLCIEYSNDVYSIIEFQHVKPGKGPAFVRTKMRSLTNGKIIDNTFPASHKITVVRVERRKFQYLYNDDMGYHFMDKDTYEQVSLAKEMLGKPELIKEGSDIEVLFHAEKETPLTVEIPQYINLAVTYTEPGLKGDTATNAMKPATMETGATIKVPLFINEGDLIKIDTRSSSYVERVKQ